MIESDSSAWDTALSQLDEAAELMGLAPGVHEILRAPKRALLVSVPFRMDDGSTRVWAIAFITTLLVDPRKGASAITLP